ncbi:MAG: hypothetical protein CMB51_06165 [Euryarchaeota archaeon]|nr:hypothetical protein [Euryarchaeota archaeon]
MSLPRPFSLRVSKAILLVAMFLLSSSVNTGWLLSDESALEEGNKIQYIFAQDSSTKDNGISEALQDRNNGNAPFADVGIQNGNESRLIIQFPFSRVNTDRIVDAQLVLFCAPAPNSNGNGVFYAAPLYPYFEEQWSNWGESENNTPWDEAGADGANDRDDWEAPTLISGTSYIFMNVTSVVQQAALNNDTSIAFVVSATNALYQCGTREGATNNLPFLNMNYTSTPAPVPAGSLTPTFVEDGDALMDTTFLLSADTSPTVTWSNLGGTNVEIDFSSSPDWKAEGDSPWNWNSIEHWSNFIMNGANGSMNYPGGSELDIGTTMHYRMRAISTTGQIGNWTSGYFELPAHDVTDNGDGTASFYVNAENLGLSDRTIDDVFLNSSNTGKSQNYDGQHLSVGTNGLDTQNTLIRLRVADIGLNGQQSLQSAEISFNMTNFDDTFIASIHPVFSGQEWDESSVTWTTSDGVNSWAEGGRSDALFSIDNVELSNNGPVSFNITSSIQYWIDNNETLPDTIDFYLSAVSRDETPQTENFANFNSSEQDLNAVNLSVTYFSSPGDTVELPQLTYPINGQVAWLDNEGNLSAALSPQLNWTTPDAMNLQGTLELTSDPDFRDVIYTTTINPTSEQEDLSGVVTLDAGTKYYWRVQYSSSLGQLGWYASDSFLVSLVESTYLGNDRHELRLRQGNATSDGMSPLCQDTYISSTAPTTNSNGYASMQALYATSGALSSILLNCDLASHALPDGYAVESASLRLTLSEPPSATPATLGLWELDVHNWTQSGATWNTYDGVNNWSTPGAYGADRLGMLSSHVMTSEVTGASLEFNATLAVQNAMREERGLDLILDVLNPGSGQTRYVYIAESVSQLTEDKWPELILVYTSGSDVAPDTPSTISPLNGSWAIEEGIEAKPDDSPTLNWSASQGVPLTGYTLEIDTSEHFNSTDLRSYTSWIDDGFDVENGTFTVQSGDALDRGKTWYWRVKGISSTFQIGAWSQWASFKLPDMDTGLLTATSSYVHVEHLKAMPELSIPEFEDTWIADSGPYFDTTHNNAGVLNVGTLSTSNVYSLIRIPQGALPSPANAHISGAELNLWVESGTSQYVAIAETLVDWNSSANGSSYDGVNNWSTFGGNNDNDRGDYLDIQSATVGSWLTLDVTYAVQRAINQGQIEISLFLSGFSSSNILSFTSTEGNSADRPWLNLTWESGSPVAIPAQPQILEPTPGGVSWDPTSHAWIPDDTPTLSAFANGSIDAWLVEIWNNDTNTGWTTYDSRVQSGDFTSTFDGTKTQMTFDAPSINWIEVQWRLTAIAGDMLSNRSDDSSFYIPNAIGGEINATDAWVIAQEGLAVPQINAFEMFSDTHMSVGSTSSNIADTSLALGGANDAMAIIRFNYSQLNRDTYDVIESTLNLYRLSGGSASVGDENIQVSVSLLSKSWNESANWATSDGSSPWADGCLSCETIPVDVGEISFNENWLSFDITSVAQNLNAEGITESSLLLQVESGSNGVWTFASSENDLSNRPFVNTTYRDGTEPWLPDMPSGLTPLEHSTMWDTSLSQPGGLSTFDINWTSTVSNASSWHLQISDDPRFISGEVWTYDLSDSNTYNGTWDLGSLTYSLPSNIGWGDSWYYFRSRAIQDYRLGSWSDASSFRVPAIQGVSLGDGNYSLTLSHGSIFSNAGEYPNVEDASIDSSNPTTNYGEDTNLDIGVGKQGSGVSEILLEFDLSDIPFPAATTPTNVQINLTRSSVSGTSPLTISAHACASVDEASITWNNKPACSMTELTRSTLGLSNPTGTFTWDITGLAQDNFANGNKTLSVLLKAVGTPGSTHTFWSSEIVNSNLRPTLLFEYVDNVDGIQPPGQVSLISPTDGNILYDASSWLIEPELSPQLSWNSVSDATGYHLFVTENNGGIVKYPNLVSTTYTLPSVSAGNNYEWWVQALNGSIPGPSSARWTFSIGNPQAHTDNGDQTWTYQFQTGNEVASIGHTNIEDSYIENSSDSNHGGEGLMLLGEDCGYGSGYACRAIISLDNGQIPLPTTGAKIHSVSVRFAIDNEYFNGANSLSIYAYPLLTSSWTQFGSSWSNSSSGVPWSQPGLQQGVEYASAPSGQTTIYPGQEDFWIDLGFDGMTMDGKHTWILIAVPNIGSAWLELASSEDALLSSRPMILVNYTDVDQVEVSPSSGTSTTADNSVTFTRNLLDASGATIPGSGSLPVVWSVSGGTGKGQIDASTGIYTPELVGTYQITGCYGVICSTVDITVTHGVAVELLASGDATAITADQTMNITAQVVDQFGNEVPGEPITYTVSNDNNGNPAGTVSNKVFFPSVAGSWTITVGWNAEQIVLPIDVVGGVPVSLDLQGCSEVLPAGTSCGISWRLVDQFNNPLDISSAGNLTWSVDNGTFDATSATGPDNQGYYTASYLGYGVGTWELGVTSLNGFSANLNIDVTHGAIADIEISASSLSVTADDLVYFNTTRIDVMGNRLPITIPAENWTYDDGSLTAGNPAVWDPVSLSSQQILTASYEGISSDVTVFVDKGAIVGMELLVNNVDMKNTIIEITSDDETVIKLRAFDSDGNTWFEPVDWELSHPIYDNQALLLGAMDSDTVTFTPEKSSDVDYTITAVYAVGSTIVEESLYISVSPGDLKNIDLLLPTSDVLNITADENIAISLRLTDDEGNTLSQSGVSYLLTTIGNGDDEQDPIPPKDITQEIVDNGGVWEASETGEFRITAWQISEKGFNRSRNIEVSVTHGDAINLSHDVATDSLMAGDSVEISVTASDFDGNTWAYDAVWKKDGRVTGEISPTLEAGAFSFQATEAGEHEFEYFTDDGITTGKWVVNVIPSNIPKLIEINVSSEVVDQQGIVMIEVTVYDEYNNQITVPDYTEIEVTGRMGVEQSGVSSWEITAVESGEHLIIVKIGNLEESVSIMVGGTITGFFAAGGPLYYAGAGLGALILVVLLVIIVIVLRSGSDDEWDDEYEDEDDFGGGELKKPDMDKLLGKTTSMSEYGAGPSEPPAQEQPPVQQQEEDTSWMADYRVDEDGTEWGQDEEGYWFYREPGGDWEAWNE